MSTGMMVEPNFPLRTPSQPAMNLAGAVLLRTIMKGDPGLRDRLVQMIRDYTGDLGLELDDSVWDELVIASSAELEHSRAHVIE